MDAPIPGPLEAPLVQAKWQGEMVKPLNSTMRYLGRLGQFSSMLSLKLKDLHANVDSARRRRPQKIQSKPFVRPKPTPRGLIRASTCCCRASETLLRRKRADKAAGILRALLWRWRQTRTGLSVNNTKSGNSVDMLRVNRRCQGGNIKPPKPARKQSARFRRSAARIELKVSDSQPNISLIMI